jgi:uncharacterized protein
VSSVEYELDHYLTDPDWLYRTDRRGRFGTHGLGHITRVLVWSAVIAGRLGTPLRRPALLWAAALHDVRRRDDGIDPEHGERAAAWVLDVFPTLRPDVAAAVDLPFVAALCRDHQRGDHLIADWSDELRVLKDADGLDRVRIHDLDPARLRLQAISPALETQAWQLMRESVTRGNTADAVRETALAMGLWR